MFTVFLLLFLVRSMITFSAEATGVKVGGLDPNDVAVIWMVYGRLLFSMKFCVSCGTDFHRRKFSMEIVYFIDLTKYKLGHDIL